MAFNSFSDEEFHLHVVSEEDSPTEESHLLHVNPAMSQSIQHFMAMWVPIVPHEFCTNYDYVHC